jgi:hypothetical protein
MPEQLWEAPPSPAVRNRTVPIIILIALAILVIGIANIVDAARYPRKSASALELQQQRAVMKAELAHSAPPPPEITTPKPDAFDQSRDGSNALSLEDENNASVWQDKTSGSRIFCLGSCMVLPASHRHHRHNELRLKDADR